MTHPICLSRTASTWALYSFPSTGHLLFKSTEKRLFYSFSLFPDAGTERRHKTNPQNPLQLQKWRPLLWINLHQLQHEVSNKLNKQRKVGMSWMHYN
jgi:hypothetical protein